MGLKLWIATCEIELLIASEGEPTDEDICDAAADELKDNGNGECWADQLMTLKQIPENYRGTVPRGEADSKTCEQIVEQSIIDAEKAAWESPMPNQTSLPLTGE